MAKQKGKAAAEPFTTFLCPHFHCDPVWLEDQATYAQTLLARTRQFLECCREDSDYAVLLSEIDYLKPHWDTFVEDRDWIRRLVEEGRLETGGTYNEPNEQNISGEGIVRNIIYGRGFHERVLGCRPRAYLCFDVFGHTPQLSQIARKAGFDGVVWSKHIKGAPQTFWGMALDGSRLVHRHVDYWTTPDSLDELLAVLQTSMREQAALGLRHDFRLVGTDFRPPMPYLLGRFGQLRVGRASSSTTPADGGLGGDVEQGCSTHARAWLKGRRPPIVGAGPSRYFTEMLADVRRRKVRLPVLSRDISLYHAGTALSRINLKIANRLAENALLSAEKFATIAALMGAAYPDRTLDKAWRQLLFGQHHDAITGTPCDISYLDLMAGYREALELATKALRAATDFIARGVKTATRPRRGSPIVVFNPLSWRRTDVCRVTLAGREAAVVDADGQPMPCEVVSRRRGERTIEFLAADVPSVGYKTFFLKDGPCGSVRRARASEPVIENEFFRVQVDPARGGGIVSLVDKRTGRELMPEGGRPGNDLVALREKPDRNEPSWEYFTTGEKLFAGDAPAQVELRRGPLSSRLIVTSPMGAIASRRQEIVLRRGIPRIDFRTEILDCREPDNLFVVIFPNNLSNQLPVFEDRYGALTRRRSRRYLDFRTHQMHMFSDCAAYSAQNFVDLGPNFPLLLTEPLVEGPNGDTAQRAEGPHPAHRTLSGLPLGFCATVTGGHPSDRDAAAVLAEALVKRGVTCTPWTDPVDPSRDLQDDLPWLRTVPEWGDKNDDLLYCGFRFSIGGPDVNAYTKKLLAGAPKETRGAFAAQLGQAGKALLLLLDKDLPEGWEPMPVLIVAGKTPAKTRQAVDELVRQAEREGRLTVPDDRNFAGELPPLDDCGLAVLNNGNIAASVESDGTLALHLMHTAWWSRVQGQHVGLGKRFVPESKDHVFAYSLIPHTGDFREAQLPRRGWEFNTPLFAAPPQEGPNAKHPAHAPLPAELSFVEVESDTAILAAFKPIGNPQADFSAEPSQPDRGLIARLYEAHGEKTVARVKFAFPVREAYQSDLIERRGKPCPTGRDWAQVELGPNAIETIEVVPRAPASRRGRMRSIRPMPLSSDRPPNLSADARGGPVRLAPLIPDEREAVQPVYSRYWEHNAGAAPVDNMPVALSLDAISFRGKVQALQVSVANDYVDATAEGRVSLEAPEGWIAQPTVVEYRLEPGEARAWRIACGPQENATEGIIRAEMEHKGQTYYDVIEVAADGSEIVRPVGSEEHDGRGCCLDVSAERADRSVRVRLRNPARQPIACEVGIISPIETWPAAEVGPYSLLELQPRIRGCVVPAAGKTDVSFGVVGAPRDAKWWGVVKVTYNGRVEYRRV